MEIIKTLQGRFLLVDETGDPIDRKDYYKIEKVHEKSNYFCLWVNELCFYLFHPIKGKMGGVYPWGFSEVRHYSERTGSFAAYRSDSDKPLVHLVFDDGSWEKQTFLEIGKECDDNLGSRPVQYQLKSKNTEEIEKLWCFYFTVNRKFAWPKENGYKWPEEWALSDSFPHSYFSLFHKDEYYELGYYDKNNERRKSCFYFNAYSNPKFQFTSIKQVGFFLVCKSQYGFYFVFNTEEKKKEDKQKPFCSSIDEPILKNGYLVVSNGENWQLYNRKGAFIENCAWNVEDEIIIKDKYVFSQDADNSFWRIYWLSNGEEVYTDWKNIQIQQVDEENVKLFVDTYSVLQFERNLNDIEYEHNRWLEKVKTQAEEMSQSAHLSEFVQEEEKILNEGNKIEIANESQDDINNAIIPNAEITNEKSRIYEQDLPDHINYVISLDKVKMYGSSGSYIDSNRTCNLFKKNDIILWYSREKMEMYISEFLRSKTYKVLYKKEIATSSSVLESMPSKFTKVDIKDIAENNLLDKLKPYFDDGEKSVTESKIKKIRQLFKELEINNTYVEKVLDMLSPVLQTNQVKKYQCCSFIFGDKEYSLQLDELWGVDNPFHLHSFLDKKGVIAILIGNGFYKESSVDGIDYEIIAQGSDKRFSQDFEHTPVNKAIRDMSKRILLFEKRGENLYFYDEVKSAGYVFIKENNKPESRELIKFYLHSLMRKI